MALGQAAWPSLRLSLDVFAHYLNERGVVEASAPETRAVVGDIFLACACYQRVPGAIESFVKRFEKEICSAAARFDHAPSFGDEVKQLLCETLFVSSGTARIAQYSGRGPLAAWVAIAARRIAGRLRHAVRNEIMLDEEAMALATLGTDSEGDPTLFYLKKRYGAEVRTALIEAFSVLDARDRTMMRLSLLQKMSLEEVGRIFGVSQSTVSRWAERVRMALTATTKQRLRERLGASAEEVESLIRMVQSQVDVSFSRVLA